MMVRAKILMMVLLLVAVGGSTVLAAEEYPARCRVTTELNVRSSPTKNASKIGLYRNWEYITVDYITGIL